VIYKLDSGRIILKPIQYYWGKEFFDASEFNYPATEVWKTYFVNGAEHIYIKHIGNGTQMSQRIVNKKFKIDPTTFRNDGRIVWVALKLLRKIQRTKYNRQTD